MKDSEKTIQRREFLGILAGGAAGLWLGADAAARAQDRSQRLCSFGVIADAQYCDYDPSGSRFYRNSLAKLAACVQDLDSQDLAWVLHLGDFIDRDFASFDRPLTIYNQLRVPHYHLLGNHDFAVADKDKHKVRRKLGVGRGYYAFAQGFFRFIVLDGNDIGVIANLPDSEKYQQGEALYQRLKEAGAPNAQTWNGAIGPKQVAWLKRMLDKTTREGKKAILFCHYPVFPPKEHNLWNDREVLDTIDAYDCVAAYINGHNHAGNYGERNGVHYLTLHGMVETPDTTAYAVVDVYPGRLVIHGRGREPSRKLMIDDKTGYVWNYGNSAAS